MFYIRLSLIFTLISLTTAVSAQQWAESFRIAMEQYQSGEYDSAYINALQSLESCKQEQGLTDNYASIARLIQNICYETGKYEEGLEFARQEITIRSSSKEIRYAAALSQQASFQQVLQQYDAADHSLHEALDILLQSYKPDEEPVTECYLNIAINYYLWGREAQALTLLRQYVQPQDNTVSFQARYYYAELLFTAGEYSTAINQFNSVRDSYSMMEDTASLEYASVIYRLAQCYSSVGNLREAEKWFESGQKIFESLGQRDNQYTRLVTTRALNLEKMDQTDKSAELLGTLEDSEANKNVMALFLSNKASLRELAGNYDDAEKLFLEALLRFDRSNGEYSIPYAETLQNLAMFYIERQQPEKAEKLLQEAEPLVFDAYGSQAFQTVSFRIKKGFAKLKAGHKEQSVEILTDALTIINGAGKELSGEWIRCLNGLAAAHSATGSILAADSILQILVNAYNEDRITKDAHYPVVLNSYASVKQAQGEFLTAQTLLQDATWHIRHFSGDQSLAYIVALENLADVYLQRGLLSTAKPKLDSVALLYKTLLGERSLEYASALTALGRYYQAEGSYRQAEPYFKEALRIFNDTGNRTNTLFARASNALAIYYQTMGNYDEAEPLFHEALDVIEKSGGRNTTDHSTTLQNFATLYQLQGMLDKAEPLLRQALAIDQKIFGERHLQYAIALKNLAVLYQKLNKLDSAQVLLQESLTVIEETLGKDHPSYALSISNLASLYQDSKKFKESEAAWLQSVELRKRVLGEDHPDYARALYGLASVYFAQQAFDKAYENYQPVVLHYLRQIRDNFPSLSEKEKGAFYLKIKPVFESYKDFCVQYYQHLIETEAPSAGEVLSQLYNIQLATKAILLNASSKMRHNILASHDAELTTAFNEWIKVKERIAHYYTLNREERLQYESLSMLQTKANDLEKFLSEKSSLFQEQIGQEEVAASDVRNTLNEGEAAVEILRISPRFVLDSVYYVALVLTREQEHPALVIWPEGGDLETRYFKFYRNAVRFHLKDTLSYRHYWGPIANTLKRSTSLYLSSDGVFNKININTLYSAEDRKHLIDMFSVRLVSNTKEILDRRVGKLAGNSVASLFGNVDFGSDQNHASATRSLLSNLGFTSGIPRLPGTEKEIDQIQTLLRESQWHVNSFKAGDASEEQLKVVSAIDVLHIATHGFFARDVIVRENMDENENSFQNPLLRSGILLAGAAVIKKHTDRMEEDGLLSAYEAMNLSLDETDLVVLSACETGLGEIRNGEGVYGLQRSFLVAGAQAVIMSLWQVDDFATQELMIEFYRNWTAGKDKTTAFRMSQLAMKEKYDDPYYWGAFIMIGE